MLLELGIIVVILVGACACSMWLLVRRRRKGDEGSPAETARIRAILAELAAARTQAAGPKPAPPQGNAAGFDVVTQQAEVHRVQGPEADGQAPRPTEGALTMDVFGKKLAHGGWEQKPAVVVHPDTSERGVAAVRAAQPIKSTPYA